MISFAMRNTSRGLAAVLLGLAGLASTACDPAAQPVIGLTSSSAYLDAARLAFESGADGLPIDTVFLSEGSNRAAPALGAAEELVTIPGIAAVVGHSNSSASLAASQIYNEHQVFHWVVLERPDLADRFPFVTGEVGDPEIAALRPEQFVAKPFHKDEYLERVRALAG